MQPRTLAASRITRPINCAISGLSIFVAAVISGPVADWLPVFFAALSGMLIVAGANTINDYYDLEIDSINRPQRPLPAGQLSPQFAKSLAIILFGSGIFFSIFVAAYAIVITVLSTILLFIYSARLKRTVLWGNVAVSLMTGVAFVYGALAAGRWREGLIPAVYAFFFHFGREVLKDMEDVKGDATVAAQTFPILYGHRPALILITFVYLLLILLTPLPYFLGIYNLVYLIVVVIGVDLLLTTLLLVLWRHQEKANLGVISNVLKADMLVGLLAIYLGK